MLQLRYLDHYKLLEVSENASQVAIDRAYAAAAAAMPRRWVDRFLAGLAGKTLEGYRTAYEELSNVERRAAYDQFLAKARQMTVFILH